jgi:hypothetical protein
MNDADRDSISVKRNALLAKKRVLDFIDLLRQKGPESKMVYHTQAKFLAEHAQVNSEEHYDNLIESISQDGIVSFKKMLPPVDYWKNYGIEITISSNFEAYIYKIRSEYHLINNSLKTPNRKSSSVAIKLKDAVRAISTNPLLSLVFGSLILLGILYMIFIKFGVNLAQFR